MGQGRCERTYKRTREEGREIDFYPGPNCGPLKYRPFTPFASSELS